MIKRLHPPRIQLGSLLIKSQIRRQPNPAALVLVLRRAVYHPRAVKNHVSGLIIGDQPPPTSPLFFPKRLCIMAQMPSLAHVFVERIQSLLRAYIVCLLALSELLFTRFANGAAVFKIHEAAARRAAVADGNPGGGEDRVAGAQEELVIMNPGAKALRHVVA